MLKKILTGLALALAVTTFFAPSAEAEPGPTDVGNCGSLYQGCPTDEPTPLPYDTLVKKYDAALLTLQSNMQEIAQLTHIVETLDAQVTSLQANLTASEGHNHTLLLANARQAQRIASLKERVLPRNAVRFLFNVLPACAQEDSRNCAWDAGSVGNNVGDSFIDLAGRTFYLR